MGTSAPLDTDMMEGKSGFVWDPSKLLFVPRHGKFNAAYGILLDSVGRLGGPENEARTILASAARIASVDSADQKNLHFRGLHLIIDMTVEPGADTVTFTIEGKDPLSGKYYTILASAALTAVATTILKVYPGLAVVANLSANDVLPVDWRVRAVHSGATTTTYSVGALLIK